MNKHTSPIHTGRARPGSIKTGIGTLLAGMLLAGVLTHSATADPITNSFSDGFDVTTPDQYPGTTGSGWLSSWASVTSAAGITLTPEVVTNGFGTPLNGGGNYLHWLVGGTTKNFGNINRKFDGTGGGVDPTLFFFHPYTVEFDYRHDSWITPGRTNTSMAAATNVAVLGGTFVLTNANDYVSFQQQNGTAVGLGNKVGFWIKCQMGASSSSPGLLPRTWSFFDGSIINTKETSGLWVNSTNMLFELATPYHFKITMYPLDRNYEASVTNLLDSSQGFDTTVATGRKLRWESAVASGSDLLITTVLQFIDSRANTISSTNEHSLDNLVINLLPTNQWPPVITNIGSGKFETLPQPAYSTLNTSGRTFYPASSNFVFTGTTYANNSLPLSGAQLTLNGVDVSGSLTASGSDSDQQRTFTFAGLKDDKIYNAVITLSDQAGHTSKQLSFFDTFRTNQMVLLEAENWNFDPDMLAFPPCDAINQTNAQPDRYIQNWEYGGVSQNAGNPVTNVANSYYQRKGVSGIDFFTPDTTFNGSNFRLSTCAPGLGTQNESSDDYNRVGELTGATLGMRENVMGKISTNMWLNYTHEFPVTNYIAYLRASAGQDQGPITPYITNWFYELSQVVEDGTSSYTNSNQASNRLAQFIVPSRQKTGILADNPMVDDLGFTKILPLTGKTTLKLLVAQGGNQVFGDHARLDYMVFLPAPPITISSPAKVGNDFSFNFSSLGNTRYLVQYKDSLLDPSWTTLTTVTSAVDTGIGPDLTTTVHDTTGGNSRVYRVMLP